jgi:hypothetical protein
MPTALAEWTTERPDEPGFYWWIEKPGDIPEVVRLAATSLGWQWSLFGSTESQDERTARPGSLWWPVRLEPPPVG